MKCDPKNPYLKGDKINLRRIRRSDAESIYRHVIDREIARYTFIPHPYLIEDAYAFIRLSHRQIRRKTNFPLGMEQKETGQIIGMISLDHVSHEHKNAELGYWLGKQFWGQGIAKEAIKLILSFGFKELKLKRIYARVMHPNIASAKLLEKSGFTYEGTMRKMLYRRNQWLDMLWFGILKDEYHADRRQ